MCDSSKSRIVIHAFRSAILKPKLADRVRYRTTLRYACRLVISSVLSVDETFGKLPAMFWGTGGPGCDVMDTDIEIFPQETEVRKVGHCAWVEIAYDYSYMFEVWILK